jgi:hypothetical protein
VGDQSPQWLARFFPPVVGVDPMIAVGHSFVIVTQDHAIIFLDRDGNVLPSKAGEPPTPMSATSFFYRFLEEHNPDGSDNLDCINRLSPQQINEFYDTRVDYDPITKRFAILSAARKSGTSDTRYYAFAVSHSQDPRDGFEQWMTTETNYRDFPRLTINGDLLLVAHNAANGIVADGDRPVLSAFHLPSLISGMSDPPNWQYYSSDLDGAARVFLVSHRGDSAGLSFVADIRDDTKLRIAAFASASHSYLAPTPIFASHDLATAAPWPGPFMVYRNKALNIAGGLSITDRVPNVQPPRLSIRTIRVPFSIVSKAQIAIDHANVRDWVFGKNAPSDASNDLVSYDVPGVAVNKHGDAIYVYGRTGVVTAAPLFPEVRYTVWAHGENQPRRSALLQPGEYQPKWFYDPPDPSEGPPTPPETVKTSITHAILKVDYATAVIDPADDETFWVIHEYAHTGQPNDTNYWTTVVGRISSTLP